MTDSFESLVNDFLESSSTEILSQITEILREQTNQSLATFISSSFQPLTALEQWAWKYLSQPKDLLFNEEFFNVLALFNFQYIFQTNDIDTDLKSKLLIPSTIDIFDRIFDHLKTLTDDNDRYYFILSQWFDNLAYLIHENIQLETSPILIHLCESIGRDYLLSQQYKFYLAELSNSQLPLSIFTTKQLFYLKTCSFLFRMYICSTHEKTEFQCDYIFDQYGKDFLQIILVHHHTVESWNDELLTCIAHLIDFICACCWWGYDRAVFIEKLVLSEQLFHDYVRSLINILGYREFHERISSTWSNNETILIDSTCIFLIGALFEMKNLGCFLRSETNLSSIVLNIAQKSTYDRISICAYGVLAEILSDDQLREVKISDNISKFFFQVLELAWKHPSQRYRRLPITQLLVGRNQKILSFLQMLIRMVFF